MRIIIFEEVKEIVFLFNIDGVIVVVWNYMDGKVNLFKVVFVYVNVVKRLGVEIYEYIEVKDIKVEDGKIKVVVINRGEIRMGRVINVVNVWVLFINKMVGVLIKILIELYKY